MNTPNVYTKKPVSIQALQFTETPDNIAALREFTGFDPLNISYEDKDNPKLIVPTLEGDMKADVGDWIIKGVKGEFYPCKPDIFEVIYGEGVSVDPGTEAGEKLAMAMYDEYCKAVGGKAFNGDDLPHSSEFFRDPNKQTQVNGWLHAAAVALASVKCEDSQSDQSNGTLTLGQVTDELVESYRKAFGKNPDHDVMMIIEMSASRVKGGEPYQWVDEGNWHTLKLG